MLNEIKNLIDEVNTDWSEYKAANDKLLKDKADKKGVAELEEKVEKISQNIQDTQEKIDQLNNEMKRPGAGSGDMAKQDDEDHQTLFQKSIMAEACRKAGLNVPQKHRLTVSEKKKLDELRTKQMEIKEWSVGDADNDTGGHLVPTGMDDRIRAQLGRDTSAVRSVAQVVKTSLFVRPFLIEDTDLEEPVVTAEGSAKENSTTGKIEEVKISVHKIDAEPRVTPELLEDAAFNVQDFIMNNAVDRIIRRQNKYAIVGSGVGQPQGVLTAGGASSTIAVVKEIDALNARNFAVGFDPDDIFDVLADLEDRYHDNLSIGCSRKTFFGMRKFKDTQGQYLWNPSLSAGSPSTFNDIPLWRANDMPTETVPATGGVDALIVGDMFKGYGIVDRVEPMRVIVDLVTDKSTIKFYFALRSGSGVLDARALRILRTNNAT